MAYQPNRAIASTDPFPFPSVHRAAKDILEMGRRVR